MFFLGIVGKHDFAAGLQAHGKHRSLPTAKGYRNRPPEKIERLEEILIGLSQIVTDFPEIAELDNQPFNLDWR